MAEEQAGEYAMNAIGVAEIATAKPLFFDSYQRNRITGSFILIDPETNATSGAGMIRESAGTDAEEAPVRAVERVTRWGHRGAIVYIGTRALALLLERTLFERGCAVAVVDRRAAAESLAEAGMLAILPLRGGRVGDVSAMIAELEREGVLQPRFRSSQGGGI
jgi:hypothetical protein